MRERASLHCTCSSPRAWKVKNSLLLASLLQRPPAISAATLAGAAVLVHPNDALLRLKQFVEAESGISQPSTTSRGAAAAAAASTIAAPSSAAGSSTAMARAATQSRSSTTATSATAASSSTHAASAHQQGCFQGQVVVSRRAADKEREYWERLTQAVGDKVVRVWGKLEQQLGGYHKLLVQRGEGLSSIAKLQQENEELRGLLNQYLGSKINSELHVPPMALV